MPSGGWACSSRRHSWYRRCSPDRRRWRSRPGSGVVVLDAGMDVQGDRQPLLAGPVQEALRIGEAVRSPVRAVPGARGLEVRVDDEIVQRGLMGAEVRDEPLLVVGGTVVEVA